MSDLGWATDWYGIVARSRDLRGPIEVGIVCNLANGSEGCVHRAGRYIT